MMILYETEQLKRRKINKCITMIYMLENRNIRESGRKPGLTRPQRFHFHEAILIREDYRSNHNVK